MKSEMDILKMDERQRQCWLLANRALIFIIGTLWLGMIGYELLQQNIPYFLIQMSLFLR